MPVGAGAEAPRSAIPWLSDILGEGALAGAGEVPLGIGGRPDAVIPFSPTQIQTSALDQPLLDGAGLLEPSETGLPADLWQGTSALRVRRLIEDRRPTGVPAARELFRAILLARVTPPVGSSPENRVLLARTDVLMDSGMLDEAEALLASGPVTEQALFRRAFDIGLLTDRSDARCAELRAAPGLSPTLPARVYCLARLGDWDAAALTLNLGRDLGTISAAEQDLLERFLDPGAFEDAPIGPPPSTLTTIEFVLREAIGLPRPTASLPLAFLALDAADEAPLKARIEARERLVREGAIPPGPLFEAYRDGAPAASGGVWDRMAAVRDLDRAFATADVAAVFAQLPDVDGRFADLGLRKAFAQIFARQLAALPQDDASSQQRRLVAELLLLAGDHEAALKWLPNNNDPAGNYLRAVASDAATTLRPQTLPPILSAARRGLVAVAPPSEHAALIDTLIQAGARGEALVRTLDLLEGGIEVDPGDLTDALYLLRAAGQEAVARQVAIETILLRPPA